MSNKRDVFRNITLITQLGIHMLTPVFLCVAIGVFIDNRYLTYFTLPLLVIGILAGARNTYMLAVSAGKQGSKKDDERGRARSMNLDRSHVRQQSEKSEYNDKKKDNE